MPPKVLCGKVSLFKFIKEAHAYKKKKKATCLIQTVGFLNFQKNLQVSELLQMRTVTRQVPAECSHSAAETMTVISNE